MFSEKFHKTYIIFSKFLVTIKLKKVKSKNNEEPSGMTNLVSLEPAMGATQFTLQQIRKNTFKFTVFMC